MPTGQTALFSRGSLYFKHINKWLKETPQSTTEISASQTICSEGLASFPNLFQANTSLKYNKNSHEDVKS